MRNLERKWMGSICNAYLTEEIANFCSLYFENHIDTKAKELDVSTKEQEDSPLPEPFQKQLRGHSSGECTRNWLSDKEYERAHLYVLSNCEILKDYELEFEKFILEQHPYLSANEVWSKCELQFAQWFKEHVIRLNIDDDLVRLLAMGPARVVQTWARYSINGFNFHTFKYGEHKSTINYGVSVSSTEDNSYYGILDNVIELSYFGARETYKTILFKCDWMDNSVRGMKVHEQYKLVEVNHTRKYSKYDPFIFAHQAEQVYYAHYPSLTKSERSQWWVVFKTKSRSHIDAPVATVFQEELVTNDPILCMIDENELDYSDVGEGEEEEEDKIEPREGEGDQIDEYDEEEEVDEEDEEDEETEEENDDGEDDDDADDGNGSDDDDFRMY